MPNIKFINFIILNLERVDKNYKDYFCNQQSMNISVFTAGGVSNKNFLSANKERGRKHLNFGVTKKKETLEHKNNIKGKI